MRAKQRSNETQIQRRAESPQDPKAGGDNESKQKRQMEQKIGSEWETERI